MATIKTIKVKKNPAVEAVASAEIPAEPTSETTPAPVAVEMDAPDIAAEAPAATPSKSRKVSDLIFALLAIAVAGCFVAIMILQGSEKAYYAAPPSLWTTGQ